MMKFQLIIAFAIILLAGCEKKNSGPSMPERDLTDKILNLVIQGRDNQFIEFPELYYHTAKIIRPVEQENLILAERLEDRGFTSVNLKQLNQQLSGRRIVGVTLTSKECECEVRKIYYFTANVSEYLVSEQIRCATVNPNPNDR